MKIFPAIDLLNGQAVRLVKGDYEKVTVYSTDIVKTAVSFKEKGAQFLHMVDLAAARDGVCSCIEIIRKCVEASGLFTEVGGGVRSEENVKAYLDAGVSRVIIGTAAVTQPELLERLVDRYGGKIAVGVDIKEGYVAIKGWTKTSSYTCFDFLERLCSVGVKTVICTDISRDGLLSGANLKLYRDMAERFDIDIVASGGVSSVKDITELKKMGIYGAIVGKALYTGDLRLEDAIVAAEGERHDN